VFRWLYFIIALSGAVSAASVNFAWDPVADSRLTGYELGWGSEAGAYSMYQPAADTTATLDLAAPGPWYIAVRALGDDAGWSLQSAWSNEVAWELDDGPTQPLAQGGLWAVWDWIEGALVMALPQVIANSAMRDSSGSGGTCTAVFSVTANDLILVFAAAWETSFTAIAPTDTQSNTYTRQAGVNTGSRRNAVYTAVAQSTGSVTVSFVLTNSNSLACQFVQVRGQADSFVHLTGTAGPDVTPATSRTIDLADTTVADTLVIGAFTTNNNFGEFTAGSGWTELDEVLNDPGIVAVYQAAATAGTYDPTGTVTNSTNYSAVGIAIIGAAASGASIVPVLMNQYASRRQ